MVCALFVPAFSVAAEDTTVYPTVYLEGQGMFLYDTTETYTKSSPLKSLFNFLASLFRVIINFFKTGSVKG